MKKKVLLTGADGFIGREAILPLLEKNYEVHAVSNVAPPEDLLFDEVIWHQTNLLEPAAASHLTNKAQGTHLLHFAWYVEHGKFWNSAENYRWVEAGLNLLKNFLENGGERVVMSGTCVEYELGKDDFLSEKTTPLDPQTIYGQCKLELQRKLSETADNWAWGRIFFLYGEREHPNRLIASVVNSLLKNEFADCSHGNQIRGFLYVKDVADAFAALLDSDAQGCFNIASGEELTIRQAVETVAGILGKPEKVRFGIVPAAANEPPRIVADVKKLSREIGWKPNFSFSQGIKETIKYRGNLKTDSQRQFFYGQISF